MLEANSKDVLDRKRKSNLSIHDDRICKEISQSKESSR